MDVNIGEMNSTVRTTDAQSLLSPQVLEQIVRVVLERVKESAAHGERAEEERRLRPKVSARESAAWD